MNKIPFSVYDFFAYLSSGAVILVTLDYVWKTGLLRQHDIGPLFAIALVVMAYVIGHVVAHFSSLILEQVFVDKILRRPATLLLGCKPRLKLFRFIFPNYHRALPGSTQGRVQEQARMRGVKISHPVTPSEGEGLFLHAYAVVSTSDKLQARLDDFRNQYGFARNMCFAFLASGAVLGAMRLYDPLSVKLRFVGVAFFIGVTLLYRYLKFFRQYSYELLLRYAELPRSEGQARAAGAQ